MAQDARTNQRANLCNKNVDIYVSSLHPRLMLVSMS